ncbi:LamG domain-containing protein [bacterium]|nr:LamG domain-containing protein [bacterium]
MMYKSRTSLFAILLAGALGLIFLTTGLAFADPPAGTISYWKLDEGTLPNPAVYIDSITATANDGQDNGTPPTLYGGASVVGTGLAFNGTTMGIDVPADTSFDWAVDDSFSIEFWVRRNGDLGAANEVMIGRDDVANPGLQWWAGIWGTGGLGTAQTAAFVLIATNGDNSLLSGTTIIAGPGAVVQGAWHHIVAVRDASAGANGQNLLYVDGALDTPAVDATYAAGFDSATIPLNMGYLDGSFHTGAAMDEVALYSRALTAAEVQEHYDAGVAGKGIDTLVDDDDDDDDDDDNGGGGGGGGCFIGTLLSE